MFSYFKNMHYALGKKELHFPNFWGNFKIIKPWFRCLIQSFKYKYRNPEILKIFPCFSFSPASSFTCKIIPPVGSSTGATKHQAKIFNFQMLPDKLEYNWHYENANSVYKLSYQELRHRLNNIRVTLNHLNSRKHQSHYKAQERKCSLA